MTICGGLFVRGIGIRRASLAICLKNIAYNISRFSYLTVKKPRHGVILQGYIAPKPPKMAEDAIQNDRVR